MGSWTDRKSYQGKAVNLGLLYIIKAANKLLASKTFGSEKEDLTIIQGSWSGAAASAGTHSGPDALDITPFNWRNREKVFRILGVAMWHRPTLPGNWNEHMHGITDGGSAAPVAQRQVASYHNRRNGLANNGADTGYRMAVFPKFVFPEKSHGKPGVKYLTKSYVCREQPTIKSPDRGRLSRGDKFTVVATVNSGGTLWDINVDGKCLPQSVLSRSKQEPGGSTPTPTKSVTTLANEVIAGKWGNGDDRVRRLKAAGYDAADAQSRVNEILGGKSVAQLAKEVIAGKWGNGADRVRRLTRAGHDANKVQAKVNQILAGK